MCPYAKALRSNKKKQQLFLKENVEFNENKLIVKKCNGINTTWDLMIMFSDLFP